MEQQEQTGQDDEKADADFDQPSENVAIQSHLQAIVALYKIDIILLLAYT
jgi:hypothetical protein